MMKSLLAATTVALFAAPALAQTPTTAPQPKPMAEEIFAKHDADKDGALSLAEVQAADAKVTQADFDKYDTDKNKALSQAEFSKWMEATMTAPASTPG
jgi:hypothetical protein